LSIAVCGYTARMRRTLRWSTILLVLGCVAAGLWLLHRLAHRLVQHQQRRGALALPAAPNQQEPRTMVWSWETPEDLTALDPARTGVAFLARELLLVDSGAVPRVIVRPRQQLLRVAPGAWLMADVRIEVHTSSPLADTAALRRQMIAAILPVLAEPQVRGLQIDFDATASQLGFYRELLRELRAQMAPGMPLSITALASWCGDRGWVGSLSSRGAPVIDEAVPMYFRMGGTPQSRATQPKDANRIAQPLCATSMGVATDETWPHLRDNERVYIFRTGPWTPVDVATLNARGYVALPHPVPRD
jgi:hypothetical protein